jgi:hypothetical protein
MTEGMTDFHMAELIATENNLLILTGYEVLEFHHRTLQHLLKAALTTNDNCICRFPSVFALRMKSVFSLL